MAGTHKLLKLSRRQIETGGVLVNPATAYTEITLSKLRSRLSETLNRVQYGKECVLVTNYGKKVAQLLPVPEEEEVRER
jgi:prevent-host-death family protein